MFTPAARSSAPAHRAPRRLFNNAKRPISALAAMVAVVTLVAGGLVVGGLDGARSQAAEIASELTLHKSVSAPNNSPYAPGETFSYEISLSCNVVSADLCTDAQLVDTLPAPLVFDDSVSSPVVVTGVEHHTLTVTETGFTVDLTDTGESGTGMVGGDSFTVMVYAKVPHSVSGEFDGADVVNTAHATASNAEAVQSPATVSLEVPVLLDSTVTKTADDKQAAGSTIPAVVDQPVDYTVGGGNASNRSVDSLVVQDPADGAASPLDGYLDFSGIASITAPSGADRVMIEYRNSDGDWVEAYPTGPIPSDVSGIPGVDPLSDVRGLRFTFTAENGQIPPTPADGAAAIVITTKTNATVLDIAQDASVTVPNTASSHVTLGATATTPKQAPAEVVVSNTGPQVAVTKGFGASALLAGESTTALISATNGARPVTELVIAEPSPGTPNLAEQGLDFGGFTDDVEWPANAAAASVEYVYADGTSETIAATAADTLPAPPAGTTVVGFSVRYTGPIEANASTDLPFTVTAQPVAGDDVIITNETTATVTDAQGKSGSAIAEDDLTLLPARVSTTVEKNIAYEELWAVAGVSTSVSISASVNDQGANASTVGSEQLIVSDPADTGAPSEFWNTFDLARITTGVPGNANLTVRYWDGSDWKTFDGAELIEGEASWSFSVPAALKDVVQGIQFEYTGKDGALLPPGFAVLPNLTVQARSDLRDGSGTVAAAAAAADPLTVNNTAGSSVSNPGDVTPDDNSAEHSDQVDLKPWPDGSGVGPDLIEKNWLQDDVYAFSDARRTARISWATEGVPFDTVAVTDDPTAGAAFNDIAKSVYDAFDLARIEAITPALDPKIAYDKVSTVELFNGGTGEWDDITADVCGNGAACDGAFPGYTLSANERASTLAVRLQFEEGTTRAAADAPLVGSGVAASFAHERGLDLTFQIRQERRSDGGPVVGTAHTAVLYNTPAPGIVNNTVNLTAEGARDLSQNAADTIQILDTQVVVSISKTFDQDELPVPPAGTDPAKYPLVTAQIVATNETENAVKVQTLSVADPSPTQLAPTAYNWLNLYQIDSITVPTGATESTVTLHLSGGGTEEYTIAQAKLRSPAQLTDVIGVSVLHNDPDNVGIRSGASTAVTLTFQMREFQRNNPTTAVTVGDQATNVAHTQATRPGGTTLDQASGTAEDVISVADAVYGVNATKSINWDERYEDQSRTGYKLNLSGQPTGNVRTTELTLSDVTPTFWNAFELDSLAQVTLPTGVRQLRVSVLTDVEYSVVGGALVSTCTLSDCWTTGEWQTAASSGMVTPAIPAGVDPADVRGVRFEVRRDATGTNWERPRNPQVDITINVTRLEKLRVGPDGEPDSYPVPSTLTGLQTAPGESEQGVTSNVLDVHGEGAWGKPLSQAIPWSADDADDASTLLKHRVNKIKVEKAPGNGAGGEGSQQYSPDSSIPYVMTITNTGDWKITGLELSDQIATDAEGALLVPMRGADPVFSFAFSGASATPPGFSASLDPDTGLISITVPSGFVFNPGDKITITAALMFRVGLPPGTPVENSISASSDRAFESCESTLNNRSRGSGVPATVCTALTTVNPVAAAPIGVVKAVKGMGAGAPEAQPGDVNYDDLGVLHVPTGSSTPSAASCAAPNAGGGYYTNSCVPITRPGGTESWRMTFTNRGNVSSEVVAAIDVLPAPGDTGVVTSPQRGSDWAPTLLGNVASVAPGATVSSYYLTSTPARACNGKDIEFSARAGDIPPTDACYADVSSRAWIEFDETTDPAGLATAKAVKFVLNYAPGAGLAPGGTAALTFETATPWVSDAVASGGLPIAWNTVAAGSRGTSKGVEVYQGPVEPVRAGVAAPSGTIALKKLIDTPAGWSAPLPSGYELGLQCVSGVTPVTLRGAGGAPRPTATVAADGTVLYFGAGTNLPLFSSCSVAETPSQGSTVSYAPLGVNGRSGAIEALRGFGDRSDIHHPFEDSPEMNLIEVTNSYEHAGFTVEKAVDNGGARDQDGTAIAYPGPYSFSASCEFLGQSVLDEQFDLNAGGTKTFEQLPASATCSIEETDSGLAASSSIALLQNGSELGIVNGGFTLTPDVDEAATSELIVTNAFTVGATTITKEFAGNGAADWGNEDFTVALSCTLEGASPKLVFSDTQVLSKTSPSWTVSTLPSGADCAVTETGTGGANGSSVSPDRFTVGSDTAAPTAVTVTNTFTTGTVRVSKALAGEPAASLAPATDGEYTVQLACTRELAGVATDITIPGGAERVITGAGFAEYTGLPSGAECTVSESDLGHAQTSTLDPSDGVVTVGVNDTVEVEVTNTFANGALEITKAVTGAGAGFAPASFDATVSCLWQGAVVPLPSDGAVTLSDGGTVTIDELPIGSACSIDEADAGQTSWTASPASVTVSDVSTAATIDVENVYELASLLVQKTVQTGEGAGTLPTRFAFSAQCTFEGAEVLPLTTFTLNDGQSRSFDGLPARSECTVIETDARGADSTVSTVSVVDAAAPPMIDQTTSTVVIPELTAGTEPQNIVGFTNLFDSSALIVTKKLEGGAAQLGSDKSFDVALSCQLAGEDPWSSTLTLNAANGFSASLGELVAGTECTVTEDSLNGADAVVITPNDGDDVTTGTVTIPDAGSTTVTVSNWFLSGSLEVTKSVLGDAAAAYGTADFGVALSCTLNGAPIEVAGGGARTVSAAQPQALFAGLPSGAECVLSETEDGGAGASRITAADGTTLADDAAAGYAFTVTTDPTVLAVEDQAQPALGLENVFNFAALTATKAVDSTVLGADGEPFDHGSFELALQCTFNGVAVSAAEPMTRTVAAGESVSWTELPEGGSCEVTETDSRGAIGTTVTVSQGELVAEAVLGRTIVLEPLRPGDADTTTVAFVNEFAAASVTLQKIVDGTAASTVSRTFPVALSCVLVDEQHPAPGIVVRDVTHEIGGPKGLTATDDALPAGAECTVTETDTGDATRTSVTIDERVVDGNTASFTLAAGGAAAATVTVTNTFTAPGSGLVVTGVEIGLAAGVGALVLGLGGVLLLVARRRRRGAHTA